MQHSFVYGTWFEGRGPPSPPTSSNFPPIYRLFKTHGRSKQKFKISFCFFGKSKQKFKISFCFFTNAKNTKIIKTASVGVNLDGLMVRFSFARDCGSIPHRDSTVSSTN